MPSNEFSIAMIKCIGHLTFQCVIDYWDAYLGKGMPTVILSCIVVAIHMDSVAIIVFK